MAPLAALRLLTWVTPPHLPVRPAAFAAYVARCEAPAALAAVLAALAWVTLAWLALGTSAVLAARVPGAVGRAAGAVAGRVTPLTVRRALEGVLGLGLAAATTAGTGAWPAAAATANPAAAVVTVDRPAPAAAPGRVPAGQVRAPEVAPAADLDRPAWQRPTADPPSGPARPVPGTGRYVTVRAGDSLWTIAARRLGAGADASDVAADWPRWYAANRRFVGPDPDLLHPGQRLVPPPTFPDREIP